MSKLFSLTKNVIIHIFEMASENLLRSHNYDNLNIYWFSNYYFVFETTNLNVGCPFYFNSLALIEIKSPDFLAILA
jgi:hypothetical protein